jgi:hypothetical protein
LDAPIDQHLDGYVPWRVRNMNSTFYLSAYYGVNLYNKAHHSDLRLFTSEMVCNGNPSPTRHNANSTLRKKANLLPIQKVNSGEPFVLKAMEALYFMPKRITGRIGLSIAPITNMIVHYLFNVGDDTYLIARRNFDGKANRFKSRNRNLIRYSFTRKCTSLYKINKENKSIDLVLDFPSTGDNAYAGIVQTGANEFAVFNYSSDPKHPKNWIRGQLGKTNIYMHRLKF